MCANTYIKGIFTSDNYYEPGKVLTSYILTPKTAHFTIGTE